MRSILLAAALAGASGVLIGAWTAHGPGRPLGMDTIGWVETGLRWQMWHAAALVAVAALGGRSPGRALRLAALAFVAGIVLFSGSLYALAATGLPVFRWTTPMGGVAFIAGWVLIGVSALTKRK